MKKLLGYGFKLPKESLSEAINVYDGDFHKFKIQAVDAFKEFKESASPDDEITKIKLSDVKFFKAYLVVE